MNMLHSLAFGATTLLLTAQQCGSGTTPGTKPGAASALDVTTMQRTWLHAHEEDHGDTLVFRPNTYAFRPSRGRTGFQINAGGELTQYDIAPTDGLDAHKGKWRVEGNTFYATFPEKNSAEYSLRIVKLTAERMDAIRTFAAQ